MSNETLLILAVVGVGGYLIYTNKPKQAPAAGPGAAALAATGSATPANAPRDKSEAQIWTEFAAGLAATGAKIYQTYADENA